MNNPVLTMGTGLQFTILKKPESKLNFYNPYIFKPDGVRRRNFQLGLFDLTELIV